ncbi:hypothetical protein [Streptomyces hokutonensis]|uniref:hypothetical protein n=1 Tax=Streptomyces hokutonensis TaxID=1306990 RepID=UPI0036BD80E6
MTPSEAYDEGLAAFAAAIDVLLKAGAADGSLKSGIDPARGGEARAGRILDLIVDGLRATP